MPRCGSIPLPPGHVERRLPYGDNLCISAPSWTPIGQGAPLYGSGGFVSTNPNAITYKEATDAAGRTTLTIGTASRGILGSICTKNCGAGMGFFGLGGKAAEIARSVGTAIATIVPAFTPLAPFYAAGSALAEQTRRSQEGMALNIGGILSAAGGILGGANLGQFTDLSRILGGSLQLAGSAFTPQPTMVSQPVYNPLPPYYPPQPVITQPQVVRTSAPAMTAAGAAMAGIVSKEGLKFLLAKVAAALGRKGITLSRVVSLVRSWGRFLGPTAVATSLGLEVAELAILLSAHSAKKRRRMNPANAHALRRAARRIKSFHRLCSHTDVIKRRGARRAAACGTCRRSPCRC